MKQENRKNAVIVIAADDAAEEQCRLVDWLVSTVSAPDAETAKAGGAEDEGKPKTPLPEEEPSSAEEDDFSTPDNDRWDPEPMGERENEKERTRGFLVGLFTAWLVTGAGVLGFRLARGTLNWLTRLTDLPVDVLVGLCMLAVLALLFRRKTRQFAAKIINWFDFDF